MSPENLPIELSAATGVPFYRQIVDQVALMIRSGDLRPNTRLPSFRDMAGHLLVSLITVRRAYADLEAAGLIVRRQGQGTFVAEEVQKASRRQMMTEAKKVLAEAVEHARKLGLSNADLREILDGLVGRGGADGND
jgi:GntR family transcriptional regulator